MPTPENSKMLALSELITREQMQEILRLYRSTVGSPAKAFLAYIKSQPDIVGKCAAQDLLPEYLAYYLEFIITQRVVGRPSSTRRDTEPTSPQLTSPRTVNINSTGRELALGVFASAAAGCFMSPVAAVAASLAISHVTKSKTHFSPYRRGSCHPTLGRRLFDGHQTISAQASTQALSKHQPVSERIENHHG